MTPGLARRVARGALSRRDVLWLASVAGATAVLPSTLAGCATSPVTGETMLVGLSEEDEVRLDRAQSPHQFSADYGPVQDEALNRYVDGVTRELASRSHRPRMPYSARVVNATYINAYTFPGGSMAATRGILLEMETEDELAALLGHETGHVNARHTAQQQGRGLLAQAAVGIASVAVAASESGALAPLVALAGQVGASALLASYSRDDERQADALGLEYLSRSEYNPDGMVRLMDVLRAQSRSAPGLIETMFASHPMSDERYATARREAEGRYAGGRGRPLARERYMDHTARLRALRPAITDLQRGEQLMASQRVAQAEERFGRALRSASDDYAGLVMMARCQLAQRRYAEADRYLASAIAVYPGEGQAQYLAGIAGLARRRPAEALQRFETYDRLLPGNPTTAFFKGLACEAMDNRRAAAAHYTRYLQAGAQDDQARYAYRRLRAWGAAR